MNDYVTCHIAAARPKMHLRQGLCPGPRWASLQRSPDQLAMGALQRGPGGPWSTQNFGWVGHDAFGPTNNWPVFSLVKLVYKRQIFIGLLLDVVDIQAVARDFACLNDSRRKQ